MTLYFQANDKFKILQMTDLHYHHGEMQNEEDKKNITLLNAIIALEKPDFVMFTGDILIAHHESDVTEGLKCLLDPVLKNRIPWAYVFGNHDHEMGVAKDHFLHVQQSLANCFTIAGPADLSGKGNFILEIKDKKTNKVGAQLVCLDSHDYPNHLKDQGKYAWIEQNQIDWFKAQMVQRYCPNFLFFHIPLPEYDLAWEAGETIGSKNEKVCCPNFNSGFFDAMVESDQVVACFVGHDHTNDFCARYQNIDLNYGRMGGYHTYGKDGFLKGGRIIELTKDQWGYQTWCRLSDGSVVNEAHRNPKNR